MTWRDVTFAVWAVLGALVVGCQVAAILSRGRLPPLGALVRLAVARPVPRALVLLGWMWLGWHAFAR